MPQNLTITKCRIDDNALEVGRYGVSPKDPTIVLLHEALGSVSHWKQFPIALARATRCNVLAYSRAGHGESEGSIGRRGRRYLEHQADIVLPAVLAHFDIRRPIVFGHSEGALIAVLFAAMRPAVPRAIILESPVVSVEPATLDGMRRVREAYEHSNLRDRLRVYHRDPDSVFRAFTEPWHNDVSGQPFLPALESVRCPALAMQGDRDEYGSLRQTQIVTRHLRHARTALINDCGHTPHREHPQVVLHHVTAFLSSMGRTTGP